MGHTCELCDDPGPCAKVELSTYDPVEKQWKTRLSNIVCPRCSQLIGPVVTAAAKSWCKKGKGRAAKLQPLDDAQVGDMIR